MYTWGWPLTCFAPGAKVKGVVTGVGREGVFVNVGAVVDGFLPLPADLVSRSAPGIRAEDMTVEVVGVAVDYLELSMGEAELITPMDMAAEVQTAEAATGKGEHKKG